MAARAQEPQWDARVTHTSAAIRLDGTLAEAVWLGADSITTLTQSDPVEGRAGTERTVVRLLASPEGLYVGGWASDSEPPPSPHAQPHLAPGSGPPTPFPPSSAPTPHPPPP